MTRFERLVRRLFHGDPGWGPRSEEPPRWKPLARVDLRHRMRAWQYVHPPPADQVTSEMFRAGISPDREHEIRIARTRWLEEHRALASFTCGTAAEGGDPAVSDPAPREERPADPVPVTVAVLPEEFVVLREGGDEPGTEPLVEVGRFPRAAFVSAHLEDASGTEVAAPLIDTFEPAAPCRLVVTWRRNDGTQDHELFAFMSLSVAEGAAMRFRRSASST
jgi:hypothetical protein